MAASSTEIPTNEGPVLNLINKRLRALRKKLNRITQMEDSISQGKTLNKEQEETFRSKPSVLAAIDELEKLRQPLSQAVDQEIELAMEKSSEEKPEIEGKTEGKGANDDVLVDLLNLMYFGSVFDVRTLIRAHDNMLTRTHERNCCLTYDYVTDDDAAGEPLKEWDLDLIANLGGLLVSRPVNSSLSHKDALVKCVEQAKLWLANSDQPIEPDSNITYAGLREKLNKIMASDYFTTTPEIKAPVDVAAAAGNYTSFQGGVISPASVTVSVEGSAGEYQQEEEQSPDSHNNEIYENETIPTEEPHQGGSEVENAAQFQDHQTQQTQVETADNTEVDHYQNSRDVESKDQNAPRRQYQNYRGGRGGGGRRGYGNAGRGGRGSSRGGGGYHQNGRSQFYDQQQQQPGGGYYPRNNYRGRGGRGMGGNYNNYHNASNADHAGHAQEAA